MAEHVFEKEKAMKSFLANLIRCQFFLALKSLSKLKEPPFFFLSELNSSTIF